MTYAGEKMLDPVQAAVREVPIHIYDFAESPPEGLEAGFYYSIPMPAEDKIAHEEIPLAGPYRTRQLAFEAARDFVRECLTDMNTGEEE